ncbi:MAG TPA: CPBP family glutamic-type intramembrane protease [Chitinophagaceae bacterium]|nr:CPBP family glutamic-type intramembrane protease [Chitinophagaceae bacterium]
MREIITYVKSYVRKINIRVFTICTLFTGVMIYLNYCYGIDARIDGFNSVAASFFYRYIIFLIAFALPYFFYLLMGKNYFKTPMIRFLVIISPAIFSWKMAMSTELQILDNTAWNYYWNQVIYWPIRLIVTSFILFLIWKISYSKEDFFGLTIKNFHWKPYVLMLLMMVPLIVAASTQADFLAMYPKLRDVGWVLNNVSNKWFYKLLHELSYGTDFISVELFFRGFLVLAFIKVAGKDAILPMACFYCTIHFGKPIGECISSYFGGIILGIVVYNTRSILGGLMVHLGLAWLMELGGYIGNSLW